MKVHEDSPLWLKVTECAWTSRLGNFGHLHLQINGLIWYQLALPEDELQNGESGHLKKHLIELTREYTVF